ncbi:hypothetical protein LTR37_021020 [Vermiconidia calcicola]|uniref:Uncharacterized protein n=1 Tax=Vermiconidia calcicola TaxID=1690605 RepID=A0ACC3MCQ4_9PEZI|nr:hypothetical protein LTR37_021020 [Vermiconidia calcicola]
MPMSPGSNVKRSTVHPDWYLAIITGSSPAEDSIFGPPWFSDAPLSGFIRGCRAKLRAPAFAPISCKSQIALVNYTQLFDVSSFKAFRSGPSMEQLGFTIAANLVLDHHESIILVTGYTQTHDCAGTYNYTTCTLESAVGEYNALIENGVVTLMSPGSPNILALANNTAISNEKTATGTSSHKSTLAAIISLAYFKWLSAVLIYTAEEDLPPARYMTGQALESFVYKDPDELCESYRDPTAAATTDASYLESSLDPGLTVNNSITGYLHDDQNVFDTNYWYFLAAALVEIICIALVVPTYYGWWNMGRSVSFSPVELAKAFQSPIFVDCNPNLSDRDIARAVGHMRVQYGCTSNGRSTKLTFADPEPVECPLKGARFDV